MNATGRGVSAVILGIVLWSFCLRPIPIVQNRKNLFNHTNPYIAVVTGGSRGSGRGFVWGLTEAGATVYATGRTEQALIDTCKKAPGPGRCLYRVVDSSNDDELDHFFQRLSIETNGTIDLLVNNAYSGLGFSRRNKMLGRPFWETGEALYDAVHDVGVRSHYKASVLAVRMMLKKTGDAPRKRRGLIVNTNSLGCLIYGISVPYGMGKCAVDKMTSGMAMELGGSFSSIDVVSWWAKEPMQTEEIRLGAVDEGRGPRRGAAPGLNWLRFDGLHDTALAGTLLMEGRALAAFARDDMRYHFSGLAVQSSQMAYRYGIRDERGLRPPPLLSVKYVVFLLAHWIEPVRQFIATPNGTALARPSQRFIFGTLPDVAIPQWLFKIISGNPVTIQWPIS